MDPKRRCPCHSRRQYRRCCGSLHAGRDAPSPETLMRSRFAAYALGLADYIIHTTDPQGPQWVADEGVWKASITRFHQSTRFLGLRVLETGPDTVRFRAELEQLGQDASFEELSRFVQREGRWLYQGRVDPT